MDILFSPYLCCNDLKPWGQILCQIPREIKTTPSKREVCDFTHHISQPKLYQIVVTFHIHYHMYIVIKRDMVFWIFCFPLIYVVTTWNREDRYYVRYHEKLKQHLQKGRFGTLHIKYPNQNFTKLLSLSISIITCIL